MVTAFCLMKVEVGKAAKVLALARRKKGVKEVAITYGAHDLLVRIDVESLNGLSDFVFNELRQITGVIETETLIASRVESGIG